MHCSIDRNRGSVLLGLLFFLAITAVITVATLLYVTTTQKILSGAIHSTRAKARADFAVLAKVSSPFPTRLHCIKGEGFAGTHSITRKVCIHSTQTPEIVYNLPIIIGTLLPDTILFPRFDYNRIFREEEFATPTAMEINTNLRIDQDTLIIAGGDLLIKSIESTAYPPVALTLVSATGTVQVESLTGSPRLRVIAWKGVELPSGIVATGNDLLPPILDYEVLGLVSTI